MRLSLAAVAATVACVQAFKDTSPFVMFSDSGMPKDLDTAQLQSASKVLDSAKVFLSQCPSETYFIIAQPSLLSSDLSAHAPHLKNAVNDKSVNGRWSVNEVVEMTIRDGGELVDLLVEKCGVKRVTLQEWQEGKGREGNGGVVVNGVLPEIEGGRELGVEDADAKLFNILRTLPGTSYTFIYHSTPATNIPKKQVAQGKEVGAVYEAKFLEPLHMDLKRDLWVRERNETNSTDLRPLFEKYQFLSPGLFMGLLVSLLLLSILWVGISAISSLEVSYGAFDKEMGPAAQKKAQ